MNEQLIEKIIPELNDELVGKSFRQMFQLGGQRFAIAFEDDEFKLLFVAVEPKEPRIYLIKRRLRDLKKVEQSASKFVVDVGRILKGCELKTISKDAGERVVEFRFGTNNPTYFVAQLTGKSSNLFLLDSERAIVAAAKKPGEGEQSLGMTYKPPIRSAALAQHDEPVIAIGESESPSEALDSYFLKREKQNSFDALANEARKKQQRSRSKLQRLVTNLETDLQQHGDPDKWKKYGDLLLANQADAKRNGGTIVTRDLFESEGPSISIDVDENDSIIEAAQKYFRKYAKAKSAAAEISSRLESVRSKLAECEEEAVRIEKAVELEDVDFLRSYVGEQKTPLLETKRDRVTRLSAGVRSFLSSDGFEILVGKKAVDNDFLTFRIANSRDTWMHAADYPGSHVVVRNPNRKEIPQKTLIEAAQIAAFYSQGKKQVKAAVNYTEKKFVNKPRAAAPGLVRLASFKTVLVEPIFPNVSKN